MLEGLRVTPDGVLRALITEQGRRLLPEEGCEQLSFFDSKPQLESEVRKCLAAM